MKEIKVSIGNNNLKDDSDTQSISNQNSDKSQEEGQKTSEKKDNETFDSLAKDLLAYKVELESLKDQLLRSMADNENIRRRAQKDIEEMSKYAISSFSKDLLSIIDNLGLALENLKETSLSDHHEVRSLREGIKITEKEMLNILEKHGISPLGSLGERFDHNIHQALFESESSEYDEGHVIQVIQRGYTIHDRLLRPALVGISSGIKS